MLKDSPNLKISKSEDPINSKITLFIGIFFFSIPSMINFSNILDIFSGNFSFITFFITSIFSFIGAFILLIGLVMKYGKTSLLLEGQIPVSKYTTIKNYPILKKSYNSIKLVLFEKEFPNLQYPPSILICKNSGKNIKLLGNLKSGLGFLKNFGEIIIRANEAKDSTNHNDVSLVAVLYLWSNKAIHLLSYQATDVLLGFKYNKNKKRYMFIEGENLKIFYKDKNLGIVEKSVLNIIDSENKEFTYDDNDFQIITKRFIKNKINFPEKLFSNMARNQAKDINLMKSSKDYQYLIKDEYLEIFEKSSKDINQYIQMFGKAYPEFLSKFRDDIQSGIRSMDNSSSD